MPKAETKVEATQPSVLSMQMDALNKSAPAALMSLIGAAMAIYTFWSPAMASGLTAWMVCMIIIASTHMLAAWGRKKNKPSHWTDLGWSRMACAIYAAAGLGWGVGGGWMVTQGNDHQILVISVIAMAAVTATFPAVVYPPAYVFFQTPLFATLSVGYAFSHIEFGTVLAIGCAIMTLFGASIGRGVGLQLVRGFELSIENSLMAERLRRRGLALEAVNRDLEIQSLTDPLTGVANRRQLMTFGRAAPDSCAMLMVDIDHFKTYNDAFGHVEGDACLVAVAETLSRSVQVPRDLVARLGGEEFAVVLTGIDEARAEAVAETICANVERLLTSRPSAVRRLVTVSIGLSYRGDGQHKTLAELMEQADSALYRAKAHGRNQVAYAKRLKKQAA